MPVLSCWKSIVQTRYLLGIDGGGTRCRVRLTDRAGQRLAECEGGPANVWSQYETAVQTMETLMARALQSAGLPPAALQDTAVVAGLAGANVTSVQARLDNWQPGCAALAVVSDVEIACVGAHGGQPGAVFICGTGSQGAAWDGEHFTSLGGWGFALSDQGSGSELGHRALRLALQAHEAIVPPSALTQHIMLQFENSPEKMLEWTRQAQPADWARVVPEVFAAASSGDVNAVTLVKQTASDIGILAEQLFLRGASQLAMMGGLAQPIRPWLSSDLQARLTEPVADALSGALMLAARLA